MESLKVKMQVLKDEVDKLHAVIDEKNDTLKEIIIQREHVGFFSNNIILCNIPV